LNPTQARFKHTGSGGEGLGHKVILETTLPHDREDSKPADEVEFHWTSRNNRKGRHQLNFRPAIDAATAIYLLPESTASMRAVVKNVGRMFTKYPFWDVSWLIAFIFTLGSVVWVFNAFFVWLPLQNPSTEFKNEILYAGGITAFIGATIFVFGSILLMLEAINENRTGCFGWAVEQVLEGVSDDTHKFRVRPDKGQCCHHHQNHHNIVGKSLLDVRLHRHSVAEKSKGHPTTNVSHFEVVIVFSTY